MCVILYWLSDCSRCAGSRDRKCTDCYDAADYLQKKEIPFRRIDGISMADSLVLFDKVIKKIKMYPLISVRGKVFFWENQGELEKALADWII